MVAKKCIILDRFFSYI